MAKMLSINDLLSIMRQSGNLNADGYEQAILGIVNQMAKEVRNDTGTASMPATNDLDGGILVGFFPAELNQNMPGEFKDFDPDGDWEPKAPFNQHLLQMPDSEAA